MKKNAVDRQKEIYVRGLGGVQPAIPASLELLEAKAQACMSPKAFAYVAGGAGREMTMQNNRSGFGAWKIIPRMLRDVSARDTAVELFGDHLPAPFLLAPIGVLELAHKAAEIAVAQAAREHGVPMIFSNQASVAMEKVASELGDSPRWFQLYWSKSNELVKSLVQRAENCKCSAIVVTLDTTLLGWRTRDIDLAYLPFLSGKGIAQYTSDPVFNRLIEEDVDEPASALKPPVNWETLLSILALMRNYPGGFWSNLRSKKPLKAVAKFISIYSRPSLTWQDLETLRNMTSLPIVLKGILHPEDARLAVKHGVDGIIVSNHGGRQVDGAISTIEALPAIVEAVNDKIPVLIDSGIRSGADTFKALALGAKAVLIGRPFVYGLAINGAAGVADVIKNFMADFELNMALSGCRSVSEINRQCLSA
ncbi:MAG: lactate 2-monooxygenase [Bacteroidetes bacterium]|nr:MAG: lactate 2-monooxygenase [Bacteroidota bacterium]